MPSNILVINSGSSSIKFSVINMAGRNLIIAGLAEKLGDADASITIKTNDEKLVFDLLGGGHQKAMAVIIDVLMQTNLLEQITAVGHRVVHGGEYFKAATLINGDVLAAIKKCTPYAPLHNPANLLGIFTAVEAMPHLPQVAVFDTAFHQTLPEHAYRYAVPQSWYTDFGVRRYGFHGTSHRYVSMEAARFLNIELGDSAFITAHLGNGASAAAVLNGQSVDTTMGFTPLEGLVMGTRSGDLDPGLIPYMCHALQMNADDVVNLLNKKSGLLGLSGFTGDVRELQQAADEGHAGATLALEVFVFRLAKYIAALTVSLPRVDALVFTGGIGENAAAVRQKVLARLASLGYFVDEEANKLAVRGNQGLITAADSKKALVINTNEELMIALDTEATIGRLEDWEIRKSENQCR